MERDDAYIQDVLRSARLAVSYVVGKTKEEFLADTLLQDAVARRLVIMGEAAHRTSATRRTALPHLPWQALIATGDAVIREYERIDWQRVWQTLQTDLPILIATLEYIVPLES
jgi:uncharacterized protein with HEPN domain